MLAFFIIWTYILFDGLDDMRIVISEEKNQRDQWVNFVVWFILTWISVYGLIYFLLKTIKEF